MGLVDATSKSARLRLREGSDVRRWLTLLAILAVLSFATGCGSQPETLAGTFVTPPLPRPTQVLIDDQGRRFSFLDRPSNELTVLFFGYTHCPDVCPTTAAELASARAKLPPDLRDRLTVVFISEDPDRDSPAAIRRWLDRFDPAFVGLIGGDTSSAEMVRELYSSVTRHIANPPTPISHDGSSSSHDGHGTYALEHASIVYAFAPDGRSLIYTGAGTAATYARDFQTLLGAGN